MPVNFCVYCQNEFFTALGDEACRHCLDAMRMLDQAEDEDYELPDDYQSEGEIQ